MSSPGHRTTLPVKFSQDRPVIRGPFGGGANSSGATAAPGEFAVTAEYKAIPTGLYVSASIIRKDAIIVPIPQSHARLTCPVRRTSRQTPSAGKIKVAANVASHAHG